MLKEILQRSQCTCLESLEIRYCSELTLFPKEVHSHALPSLRSLRIVECLYLMALPSWISHLTSLQEFKIMHCPKLQSLPQGMSQLTNLRLQEIIGCPDLRERCQRDTNADWAQISQSQMLALNRCG